MQFGLSENTLRWASRHAPAAVRMLRIAPKATALAMLAVAALLFALFLMVFSYRYNAIFDQKDAKMAALVAEKDTLNARIATLEERLRLRDDQLADKLHSTPPNEAKAIIQGLEDRLNQLSPRRIKDPETRTLAEWLKLQSGVSYTVTITHDGTCADCNLFAADFSSLFRRIPGWNVRNSMGIGISNMPASGIAIRVNDTSKLTEAQKTVLNAFRATGILAELQPGLDQGANVEVLITAKTAN